MKRCEILFSVNVLNVPILSKGYLYVKIKANLSFSSKHDQKQFDTPHPSKTRRSSTGGGMHSLSLFFPVSICYSSSASRNWFIDNFYFTWLRSNGGMECYECTEYWTESFYRQFDIAAEKYREQKGTFQETWHKFQASDPSKGAKISIMLPPKP